MVVAVHSIQYTIRSEFGNAHAEPPKRSAQGPRRRPGASISGYDPSLPALFSAYNLQANEADDAAKIVTSPGRPSGPKPPPSWYGSRQGSSTNTDAQRNTSSWRHEALSLSMRKAHFEVGPPSDLIWEHDERQSQERVAPSLRHLCLQQYMISDLATLYPPKYISSLPPHIRFLLARYAAIISPLGLRASKAIWGSDRHAQGEAILVGSSRTTRWIDEEDMEEASNILFGAASSENEPNAPGDWSWDDEVDQPKAFPSIQTNVDIQEPLTSLFILHAHLPDTIFTRVPHTLIHLSLVALPSVTASLPLRLLMRSIPRLRTLDISYNHHLVRFDRIIVLPWGSRWKDMNTLGMRYCWSTEELAKRCVAAINEKRPGRWIETVVHPTYKGP